MTETPDRHDEQGPREDRPAGAHAAESDGHQAQARERSSASGSGGPGSHGGAQAYGPPGQGAPGFGPPLHDPTRGSGPQGYGPPADGSGWPAGYEGQGYGPPGYGNAATGSGPQGYGPPGYIEAPAGYGPPGYVAPGYGPPSGYGPPGFGAAGYGPPGFHTAPRPGIIPLRPLGLGDFFGAAFAYIRANPASTLLPALVVAIVLQLVQFGAQGLLGVTASAATALGDVPGYLGRSLTASGIVTVIGLVLSAALAGVLITVLRGALVGRRTDLGTAWRAVRSRVPGLMGVVVLSFLVVAVIAVVGFGVAVGIGLAVGRGAGLAIGVLLAIATFVVLVYVAVVLSMATPAYVMEEIGVVAALNRSRALVRGAWWPVFGVLLLAGLLFGAAAGVLELIVGVIGVATSVTPGALTTAVPTPDLGVGFMIAAAVVAVFVTTFGSPFVGGITALLYVDQRIRRERFDLDLARAASG